MATTTERPTHVRDREVFKNITKHEVILLVREWFDENGEPPRLIDWDPKLAERTGKPEIADRYYEEAMWPPAYVVVNLFGNFTNAVIEAGFYPRRRTIAWVEANVESRAFYLRQAIALLKKHTGEAKR